MQHKAYLYEKSGGGQYPWHVECSCGPGGDFSDKVQAMAYIKAHFAKQTGVFTTELIEADPSAKKPITSFPPKAGSTYTPKAGV